MPTSQPTRCQWCSNDPIYRAYHDTEWGRPVHDDDHLFGMLVLEGAQAGLAWITILRKREGYLRLFHGLKPAAVAAMTDEELDAVLQDPSIVRNKLKVQSARRNARVFLALQQQYGSVAEWIWKQIDHTPIINHAIPETESPRTRALAASISQTFTKAGMNFAGPTVIYAWLQACGFINDHSPECHLYAGKQQPE